MSAKPSKTTWSAAEYDSLAAVLIQTYPDRQFGKAARVYDIQLNDLEFTPVMQATLPAARQLLRPKLQHLKRDLMQAFKRSTTGQSARPAPQDSPQQEIVPDSAQAPTVTRATPQAPDSEAGQGERQERAGKVFWTPDEWKLMALALHTLCPELDLINASDMRGVTLQRLNQAASVLPAGRQRHFKWLGHALERVQKIYAEARAGRDPMYYGRRDEAQLQVETAAADVPPKPIAVESAPAAKKPAPVLVDTISTAPHKPVAETRIFWTPAEWIEIASEIDRLNPHAKYPERGTCGALTTSDIMQAQRVLPAERRRHLRTQPMDKLRQPLLTAFREVRKLKTELAAVRQQEALQVYEERRLTPPPNPYEVAFKPLVDLIAREVTAQLLPALLQMITAGQAAVVPQQAAANQPVRPGPREVRMRVGVVNNRLTFADELRREFPQIDFTFADIDRTNSIDSVTNCDRVIVLTKFISHQATTRVKKAVGDRYVPLNGSITDMKRVLTSWLNEARSKVA